jgi:hypothetical protein
MAFRSSLEQVAACEAVLGFEFPAVYRQWMVLGNGIELEIDGCSWFLRAVECAPGRASDVVAATRKVRSHHGWPPGAVSIGFDGGGGQLFLLRRADGVCDLGFWGGRYGLGCVRVRPVETAFRAP